MISFSVITGLVPVIPLRDAMCPPDRDGRDKPGHDKSPFTAWFGKP
jgi:hypothetical protein